MDQKDLKQIKEVIKEGFREGFTEVWEGNLEPAFGAIEERVDKVEQRIDEVEGNIAKLPTKSYLDEKFADLEGSLIVKLRKEDNKLNRLAEMLKQKAVLTDSDLKELANFQIFPR